MWSLRHGCGDVCHYRATSSIKKGEEKRDRAVLRQYSIKFVYFFNHCDLSGCNTVYGWVVLPKKAPQGKIESGEIGHGARRLFRVFFIYFRE
jgi:hypothetical protein